MDLDMITTLLSNFAFPVVCTLGMFWMWNKERDEHRAEVKEMTEAINRNTVVMEKILTELEGK